MPRSLSCNIEENLEETHCQRIPFAEYSIINLLSVDGDVHGGVGYGRMKKKIKYDNVRVRGGRIS